MDAFEGYTGSIIENIFPEKNVTISDRDKPYITEELKLIRRQRMRVYRKEGRSTKYLSLLNKFEDKMKIEAEKYHQKIMHIVHLESWNLGMIIHHRTRL